MAGKSSKFVADLDADDEATLQVMVSVGESSRLRNRAQAVLWSSAGRTISDIADLICVTAKTVSGWIDRWTNQGLPGLVDQPRCGAPTKLTAEESKTAIELLDEHPHSPAIVLQKIEAQIGKRISGKTLSRMARKAKRRWKRMRRSLKSKQDPELFRQAQSELEDIKQWHDDGDIDLYFGDESGFSLIPTVPYGWLEIGTQRELPSFHSSRYNVFGLLGRDQTLWAYQFEGAIDSDSIIACLDDFSLHLQRPTLLVLDNASIHKSNAITTKIQEWEDRGLYFYYLPPYCPELNLIEALWRMIKHHWLPLSAYKDMQSLKSGIQDVFDRVGSALVINVAC